MEIYSCLKGKRIRAKAEKPLLFTHSWGLFFPLCFDSLLKSSSMFKYTESPFSQDNSGPEEKEEKSTFISDVISKQCIRFTLSHWLDC